MTSSSASSPNESNATDSTPVKDENENDNKSSISSTTNSNGINGTSTGPSLVTFEQIRRDYELTDEVLRNASSLETMLFSSCYSFKKRYHSFIKNERNQKMASIIHYL